MALTPTVPQPVVLLDAAWTYKNTPLVKGDIFELPNREIASIREHQEHQVGYVEESSLTPKASYFDGIIRAAAGAQPSPVYVSSEIGTFADDVIHIVFDIETGCPAGDGWTVEVDSAGVAILNTWSNDNGVYIRIAAPVVTGEVVTVAYDGNGKTYSKATGGAMDALIAQAVANNT